MKYQHVIAEVLSTPWAILPETLQSICNVLAFRAEGGQLTDEEIKARIGVLRTEREPYVLDAASMEARRGTAAVSSGKGVAVIPVYGVIAPKAAQFERASSGGVIGIDALTANFREALSNPDISAIVLDIDSPGGSVYGVQELADEIYAARPQKQIVAQVSPMAASAAYWLAASASSIAITPSGAAGSIGVFMAHSDISKALENEGIKVTLISAGRYKTEGHPSQPLTEEARGNMQQRADQYYEPFVGAVARGRNTSAANVRGGFGEGRVVGAQDAIALGMADRIATLDQTLSALLGRKTGSASAKAQVSPLPAAQASEIPATAETHKEATMATGASPAAAAATVEIQSLREAAINAETLRVQSIQALARHTNMADKAAGWVREGKSVSAVSDEINAILAMTTKPVTIPEQGAQVTLSDREHREYSLLRGVRNLCGARMGAKGFGADSNCLEFEISDAIAKKLGQDTAGFWMPTNLRLPGGALKSERAIEQYNAVLTGGATPGSNLVQTTLMPSEFIELLRNMQVTMALGARKMSELQGNIGLPKQTGAGTLSWTGENPGSAVTAADQNYSQVTMSPKTAMAQTVYSRQWILQSSMDADQLTREDLAAIFAIGLDLAGLRGTGTSNQPTGVANTSGINTVSCGTNGGAITYNLLVDAQTAIETANIPLFATGIACTPGVKGKLRKTAKLSNSIAEAIWGDDNAPAGWPGKSTNQLASNGTKGTGTNLHQLIAGAWNQLVYGEWGALEIIADPYTQAGKNNIVLTGNMLCDVAVRYAAAFTLINDIDITQ